jgi:hypothetical protein
VAEAQTSSIKGLTRGKAILIGVLAVALVAVLYVQFGRGGEKPVGEVARYRRPRPAAAVESVDTTPKSVTLATVKTPSNAQAGNDKSAATAPLIDETRWKSPKLETIVAYDPFALPAAFPQPPTVAAGSKATGADGLIAAATADDAKRLADEVEKLQMQLEELTQRGVHVIVRERDQYAAVIGDRLLHVGDKINEFTVTAIDPDGVHVEMKESP